MFVSTPCVEASAGVHVGHSAAQRDENSRKHTHTHRGGNGGMVTVSTGERERIISCYVIPAKT